MIPLKDHNKSHKFPLITIIIIALNALLFGVEMSVPDLDAFLLRYALVPAQINFLNIDTLYPFISSMFLHGGFMHILRRQKGLHSP